MRTQGRQALSAVDGFLRAFSMMSDIKNQRRSQDRQDGYMQMAQEQHERSGESHELGLQLQRAEGERAGERHDWQRESHKQGLGLQRRADNRAQEQHERAGQLHTASMEDRAESKRRQAAREWAAAIANDLDKRGKVSIPTLKGWSEAMDIDLRDFLKPEFKASLAHLEGVLSGEQRWRDPNTVRAMNTVFGPMIQRNLGEVNTDGIKITGKEIADVYPGPKGETLIFKLRVHGEKDGQPVTYEAPMTRNRQSSADDDQILEVPIDNFIKHVRGRQLLDEAIQMGAVDADDFEQELLDQYADRAALTSGGQVPHEQLGLPRNQRGSVPAHVATADWLMQENPNLTREQALQIAQRRDPTQFAQDYAKAMMEQQRSAMLSEGDPGYRSYDQLLEVGLQKYEQMTSRGNPGGGGSGEGGGMQPDPADVQPGQVAIMEDGSAWTKAPDGTLQRLR